MAASGSGNATASNFPDEQIIRQVRNHSCLYDPRENDYKDADRKAAVWREIANNVGMTAIECEHRWRYLRDRYTRERKRKSQQSQGGTNGQSKGGGNWPLASQMHFIQDFIKHRSFKFKARGGASGHDTSSDSRSNAVSLRQQQLIKAETGDNNQTSSDETEEGPSSPGFDQQSVAAADCYPMVILEETDTHHLIDQGNGPPRSGTPDFRNNHNDRSSGGGAFNGSPNSPRMAYNEDELFCLSVAQTLRRLPLMRRSMAKVQILQLIHDTEFGHS